MPLVVRVEDENGAPLGDDLIDDHRHFERLLPDLGDPRFPFLQSIDPYGDTRFGALQIGAFRAELATLRQTAHAEAKAVIDALDKRAHQVAESASRLFLKFYGD